jgi:hypothetical protein
VVLVVAVVAALLLVSPLPLQLVLLVEAQQHLLIAVAAVAVLEGLAQLLGQVLALLVEQVKTFLRGWVSLLEPPTKVLVAAAQAELVAQVELVAAVLEAHLPMVALEQQIVVVAEALEQTPQVVTVVLASCM